MYPFQAKGLTVLLDRIRLAYLSIFAILFTLTFALAYWLLSAGEYPTNGLSHAGGSPISFLDALYFSLVTETTVGYGDLVPLGISRLVASAQVVIGLLFAGVAVAKITSLPGRDVRLVGYRAAGDWLETTRLSDGQTMATIARFSVEGATLRYDGENYIGSTEPAGFFRSELLDYSGSVYRFHYSNRDSQTDYFVEGITSIQFTADERGARWVHMTGTTHDFGNKETGHFQGVRASVGQSGVIHGSDLKARQDLIQSMLSSHP